MLLEFATKKKGKKKNLIINILTIPVETTIRDFWISRYPDCVDLFDNDNTVVDGLPSPGASPTVNLVLAIAPNSYRPTWETQSEVLIGAVSKVASLSSHRLEGFTVDLGANCNCAMVYYLLKELEENSKAVNCGTYQGITVYDYLLPELADIKAGQEFTERKVLLEIESSTGAMGRERDRSLFGITLICQIL